jgi:CHAT domain-containing protein
MNSAYPLYSGLLLSSSEKQDGELDVHELFTMDLNAYLVVLSACQTGLGHLTNGDELVGLSRAFIYAGTPSVISSLWMVEDESTSYLMEQFYNNLKKYNKAESLQKAQLQTKKKYNNLRSWASFVLVGES